VPLFDHVCDSTECVRRGEIEEHYFRHASDPEPLCASCGVPQRRLLSLVNPVFVGEITARYNDKSSEKPHEEGHWAYRKRSTRNADGSPERVRISTWQQQKEYCKAEGLVNPKELPSNVSMGADGKSMKSNGLPGQWV
jgi:hypothetical protein